MASRAESNDNIPVDPDRDTPVQAPVREQAGKAWQALWELHLAALEDCGLLVPEPWRDQIEIKWTPQTSPEEFAAQVCDDYREACSESAKLRQGRVHCFHCRTAACEHAVPLSESQVFAGYEDTGRPRWHEFFNFLAQLGDTRIDQLFTPEPIILSRVVGREPLIRDQLSSFGQHSNAYHIVGQTIAGYFNHGSHRFALTMQVVETKGRELHFQLLTTETVRQLLADEAGAGRSFLRLYDQINDTRRQIEGLRQAWCKTRVGRERNRLIQKVFGHLRHLTHACEQRGRQQRQRTAHARQRSLQNRPVHMANIDVASAAVSDFFFDQHHESIVVLGKNSRAHIFSREGKQITSLSLPQDKLAMRLLKKRYIPLAAAEKASFLSVYRQCTED